MDLSKLVFPSFKRRILGKVLDLGVMTVLGLTTLNIGPPVLKFILQLFDSKWTGYRTLIPIGAILHVLAYLLFADAIKGQSIGKRLCGLKVITLPHGTPCDCWHSIYRNVCSLFLRSVPQCFRVLDGVLGEAQQAYCNTLVVEANPMPRTRQTSRSAPLREPAKIDLAGIRDYVRQHKRLMPDSQALK